jgi:hypothetical protein
MRLPATSKRKSLKYYPVTVLDELKAGRSRAARMRPEVSGAEN